MKNFVGAIKQKVNDPVLRIRLKVLRTILQFMRDPAQTNLVFDLDDLLFELQDHDAFLAPLRSHPASLEVISQRRLVQNINLETLVQLTPGSLGRSYADHMIRHGLSPDFYRIKDSNDDLGFVVTRIRQTHDLWHVVNDYDTEMLGEMSLQAFSISYLGIPTAMILVGAQFIRTAILDPAETDLLRRAIAEAFRRGSSVGGLFAYDWESNWSKPLAEVRAELHLSLR